jgi:hypothetical protein
MENDQLAEMVVIAAEPKELSFIDIVGSIDPEQLSLLGGQFGIPKMDLEGPARTRKGASK